MQSCQLVMTGSNRTRGSSAFCLKLTDYRECFHLAYFVTCTCAQNVTCMYIPGICELCSLEVNCNWHQGYSHTVSAQTHPLHQVKSRVPHYIRVQGQAQHGSQYIHLSSPHPVPCIQQREKCMCTACAMCRAHRLS